MPSQLISFSSSDVGGPGLLTGTAGSLLAILDACLVTGYSGHTLAAQWTKPFANSGNIGCYKQGAGAGLSLLINDNGPNVTSTYKEAWAVGWESIAGIGAPVGTGSGQFPTPAQLLTTGHVVWRKSATADTATRGWQLFADSSTFYLFIATGDTAGVYYPAGYGDIFSLHGSSDAYRAMIIGRAAENQTAGGIAGPVLVDAFDAIWAGVVTATPTTMVTMASQVGHYLARSWAGAGTSVQASKFFDTSKQVASSVNLSGSNWFFFPLGGYVQTPNGPDNSLYLSPIMVGEGASAYPIRGRLRGIYQVCHPIASFADGQPFSGGGDYAGKSFQIIKSMVNGGFLAVETSATVETN